MQDVDGISRFIYPLVHRTLLPLLFYIQRMLLSVHLHIVTTFFKAVITHAMLPLPMHSLSPVLSPHTLLFLLSIIHRLNSVLFFPLALFFLLKITPMTVIHYPSLVLLLLQSLGFRLLRSSILLPSLIRSRLSCLTTYSLWIGWAVFFSCNSNYSQYSNIFDNIREYFFFPSISTIIPFHYYISCITFVT